MNDARKQVRMGRRAFGTLAVGCLLSTTRDARATSTGGEEAAFLGFSGTGESHALVAVESYQEGYVHTLMAYRMGWHVTVERAHVSLPTPYANPAKIEDIDRLRAAFLSGLPASQRPRFEAFTQAPRPLPLAERIQANRAVFRDPASRRVVVEPTVRRKLRAPDGGVRGYVSSLTVDYAGVRTRGAEIISEPSFRTSVEPPSIPIYPVPPEPNAGLEHGLFVRFDAFANSRGQLVIVGNVAVDPWKNGEIYPAIAVHPGTRA